MARQRTDGRQVRSGETVAVTIAIANGTDAELRARIVELLPPQLQYLVSSASVTASYDAQARMVLWEDVIVPAQSIVRISFAARAEAVSVPTQATLTMQITLDGSPLERDGGPLSLLILP